MEDYSKIVKLAQNELKNEEWKKRYKGYVVALSGDLGSKKNRIISEARKKFDVPKPFALYQSVSMAKSATKNRVDFELRFHGQSVGVISVLCPDQKECIVNLTIRKGSKKVLEMAKGAHNMDNEKVVPGATLEWKKEAREFREAYKKLEEKLKGDPALRKSLHQPEHDMESELLKNYSQKTSKGKEIEGIQPVKMAGIDARFQMPTPLCASKAKNEDIHYAKQHGGGIDILARVGYGGASTQLAILELKDEYNKSEPPEKAIKQAIAYAVFIRELLRCEEAGGNEWWSFFGFGGSIPKPLVLKAVIVMPVPEKPAEEPAKDFAKVKIPVDNNDNTGDAIELEYIYRTAAGMESDTSLYQRRLHE